MKEETGAIWGDLGSIQQIKINLNYLLQSYCQNHVQTSSIFIKFATYRNEDTIQI